MAAVTSAVGSAGAQMGSPKASRSESVKETSGAAGRMSLPQVVPVRDWELDLDKLQVGSVACVELVMRCRQHSIAKCRSSSDLSLSMLSSSLLVSDPAPEYGS